jgi:hypothetical protein
MRATIERGWKMKKVKVRRLELLEKLKTNYKKHMDDYNQAVIDYKDLVINLVKENKLKILKEANKFIKDFESWNGRDLTLIASRVLVSGIPSLPQHYGKDYEQVIAMMEMEVEENVELEADQFACYVLDDWEWKRSFEASNVGYATTKAAFSSSRSK